MTIRNRLQKLERRVPEHGACPLCARPHWKHGPAGVLVSVHDKAGRQVRLDVVAGGERMSAAVWCACEPCGCARERSRAVQYAYREEVGTDNEGWLDTFSTR